MEETSYPLIYYDFRPFSVGKRVSSIAPRPLNAHAWDRRVFEAVGRLRREDRESVDFLWWRDLQGSWVVAQEKIRSGECVESVGLGLR